MARKSAALRLQQSEKLISEYEAAGLGDCRNCNFVKDMVWYLKNNRSLSPKRRAWLDSLIEEGVPAPKNEGLVKEILAAANLKGMERRKAIMTDFAGKLHRGWTLSAKQQAWLDSLMAEAKDIKENGIWAPDDELKAKMEIAVRIGSGKNGYYWQHRPGTAKSHDRVANWLAHPEDTQIDEWACKKLLKAYKTTFNELENPSHEIGALRNYQGQPALVSGVPFINDRGTLVYPLIVNGQLIEANKNQIGKRFLKNKK